MVEKLREMGSGKGLIGEVLGFWPWRLRVLHAVSGSPVISFAPIWLRGDSKSNSQQVGEIFTFLGGRM